VLNDVLDLSKIEAGRLDLDPAPFSARSLMVETARLVQMQAQQKHLLLGCQVDQDMPPSVVGDATRLRQVLLNLLGNAIKFTAAGSVTVRAALDPEQPASPGVRLRFSVADTGIGIPKEKQSLIFEAFRQADNSTTRQYGGTGLGLAICSRLVALMGGRIWVESEAGRGSTFQFTALVQRHSAASAPLPPLAPAATGLEPSPPRKLAVLLAEDNVVNQKVTTRLLEKRGHSVTVASNGVEAVALAAERPFDVVLMDVHMPIMDGYEATRRIREAEVSTGAHLRIIALTACAMAGDREKCLDAGMDGYTDKPIDRTKLMRAVEEPIDTAPTAAHGTAKLPTQG
jgi:CheY-like chemotaxis protein